jgi:DNA-binding HxlR family transcriptional regulator
MLRRTYDSQVCSVAWTLEVVGERWTLLIVRDALLGVSRFGTFRERLGITASVLKSRLDRLVAAGVLDRSPYHNRPVRYEYLLTPKGRELGLVVLALMHWGDQHLAGDGGPPRTARHDGCGGPVQGQLVCMTCAAQVSPDQVTTQLTERAHQPQP